MAYRVDLGSAWAKLERAKVYVEQLRAEIYVAGEPDPYLIPLRQEYDAEDRAVVLRVERTIHIGPEWPLILGDAVHNMRCSLDHLAWQLALKHLDGREPPSNRRRDVQFPIVSHRAEWSRHPHRKFMDTGDADVVEEFQPFQARDTGLLHPLAGLRDLNDTDKHRRIHVFQSVASVGELEWGANRFTDCHWDNARRGRTGIHGFEFTVFGSRPPHPNDEVMRIYVVPEGPNPDVELKYVQSGYVSIREGWNVLEATSVMARFVGLILARFGPLPPGVAITPPFTGPEIIRGLQPRTVV